MKLKLKNYNMVTYDFSADEEERENISDNQYYDWDIPDDLLEEPDLYTEYRR